MKVNSKKQGKKVQGGILKPSLPDALALVTFAIAAFIINWKMIQDGILFAADDIWWHLSWLQQFPDEIREGIFYPRWLALDNYGYGSPTFIFYPPLVYYFGALVRSFIPDTLSAGVWMFIFSSFFSAVSFYFFARQIWGSRGACLGALAYVTAPYFCYDVNMRAALAETWAYVWLPLLFLSTRKSVLEARWRPVLAVSLAGLCLTHVPGLIMTGFVWGAYVLFLGATNREHWKRTLFSSFTCAALGFTLSAVYVIPMLSERSIVDLHALIGRQPWSINLGEYQYHGETQLLPQITYYTLIVSLFTGGLAYFLLHRDDERKKEIAFWIVLAPVLVLLMAPATEELWNRCALLQFLQFPSRWLMYSTLSMGCCVAALISSLQENKEGRAIASISLSTLVGLLLAQNVVMLNQITYFRAGIKNPVPVLDDGSIQTMHAISQFMLPKMLAERKGFPGVPEYRPLLKDASGGHVGPKPLPLAQPGTAVMVTKGDASINVTLWNSHERDFDVKTKSDTALRVRTYWYPAWKLTMDGQPIPIGQDGDGLMTFSVPAGAHQLRLRFVNTGDTIAGAIVSALSLAFLLYLVANKGNLSVPKLAKFQGV